MNNSGRITSLRRRKTHILLFLLWLWIILPQTHASGAEPEDTAGQIAARTLQLLATGEYSQAFKAFDRRLQKELPVEQLAKTWEQLQEQAGAFGEVTALQIEDRQEFIVVAAQCRFARTTLTSQFVLNDELKITGLLFLPAQAKPQEEEKTWQIPDYVRPEAFEEREVTIGQPPWELPGRLCLPKGLEKAPAIILISGLGPHDADLSTDGVKPFRDLAWGLASRGIVTLRYANRRNTWPEKMNARTEQLTVRDEITADALEAIKTLRAQTTVQSDKIFVLGHDFAGSLVPRLLKADDTLAGGIVLAGVARPLEEAVLAKKIYLAARDSHRDGAEEEEIGQLRQKIERLRSPNLTAQTPAELLPLNHPGSFWLDLRDYQPHTTASTINKPLLVLQGGRDYQTTLEDFRKWKNSLANSPTATCRVYLHLNHNFIVAPEDQAVFPPEDQKSTNVALPVIEDISRWVTEKNESQ